MSYNVGVTITQKSNYQFLVVLVAVRNCLSASLFFSLNKFKQHAGGIITTGTARVGRDADKRLCAQGIDVVQR